MVCPMAADPILPLYEAHQTILSQWLHEGLFFASAHAKNVNCKGISLSRT